LGSGKPIRSSSRLEFNIGYRSENPVRYARFIIQILDFRTFSTIIHLDSDMTGGLSDILSPEGLVTCITDNINLSAGQCIVEVEIQKGTVKIGKIYTAGYLEIDTEVFFGNG